MKLRLLRVSSIIFLLVLSPSCSSGSYLTPYTPNGSSTSWSYSSTIATTTNASTPLVTPSITKTSEHVYFNGALELGGDGDPIELINNPKATNPTYAQLLTFIEEDPTDEYPYVLGPPQNAYVCADFAETVHNNAEAAGIRAAWVGIHIIGSDGHAVNAFETTDVGLVFIDCTGKGLYQESNVYATLDRRAKVEVGQPYAVSNISKSASKFLFSFHVDNKQKIFDSAGYENWLSKYNIKEFGTEWTQAWVKKI